jgi:hypothetical protein
MLVDVVPADERTGAVRAAGDYSSQGYRLRGLQVAYDLVYRVDFFAAARATQTRLIEHTLRELGAYGRLLVNGAQLPVEPVVVPALEQLGGVRGDRMALHYKVSVRQELAGAESVKNASTLVLTAEMRS